MIPINNTIISIISLYFILQQLKKAEQMSEILDDKRKRSEILSHLRNAYLGSSFCEFHDNEYCLTYYEENPEQHVQLNDSMLLVWASYIVSILLPSYFIISVKMKS